MTILWIILAIVLMLIGAAGTVLPALPGLPLMFVGAWLLGFSSDYQIVGSFSLWLLLLVTLFGMAMDFLAGLLGAKYTGASRKALMGAFIGGIAGIFFTPAGLVLGPLLGAAIGEFIEKRSLCLAGKVGIGTFIGFIVGMMAKIGAALVIVLVVLTQYVAFWVS